MASSLIILVIYLITYVISQTFRECGDYEECASSNRINRDEIICSGSRSCADSTTILSQGKPAGYIECSGESSCDGIIKLKSLKNIYCSGYKSCGQSGEDDNTIDAKIIECSGGTSCALNYGCTGCRSNGAEFTATQMYCSGSNSCYNTDINVRKKLYCSGSGSCAGATGSQTILNVNQQIHCDGAAACSATRIKGLNGITTGKPTIIYCRGVTSCQNALIQQVGQVCAYGEQAVEIGILNSVETINAYGYQSLQRATINTDSTIVDTLSIKAFGDQALRNANINCENGMTCNLICKGTGCQQGKYNCAVNATCNIVPAGCLSDNSVDDVNGIVCPTFSVLTTSATAMVNNEDYVGNIDERRKGDDVRIGKLNDVVIKSDITECTGEGDCDGLIINDTDVECYGKDSCVNAIVDGRGVDGIIRCSGDGSCNSARLQSSYRIVCTGAGSCISAIWGVEGGSTYDMYCYGAESCINTTSIDTKSSVDLSPGIACSGVESCRDTKLDLNTYDTIGGRYGNIACSGYRSCINSELLGGYSGSIYCSGYEACKDAKIVAYVSWAICYGGYSCENAEIEILCSAEFESQGWCNDAVSVDGYYSAYNSKIKNAPRVWGSGYYSLADSIIDSGDRAEMSVTSLGHNSGYGATVICRNGTVCDLYCRVSGCDELDYVCLPGATCTIDPSGCENGNKNKVDGVDCPNLLTSIAEEELDEFLRKKEKARINSQRYKDVVAQKEEYETEYRLLRDDVMEYDGDIDYELDDEREIELFGDVGILNGENKEYVMKHMGIVFIIFGVLFIMVSFIYIWQNNKREYEPLK